MLENNIPKKFIRLLLQKFSRIVFFIYRLINYIKFHSTPIEFKNQLPKKSQLQKKIYDNVADEMFENFKDHFKRSLLMVSGDQMRDYAIQTSLLNDKNNEYYYLEFGVYKGGTANYFSKYVKKLYAFDSFEGLSEDWIGKGAPKGTFNLNKKIPKLNSNVEPIIGWVEDTLDDFLKKHNPKINFVHMDFDIYSPTKFTLKKLKPFLIKNSIIIFDNMINYPGWQEGEYKALNEVFNENEFDYKAFRVNRKQCIVQIR
tara:strand:+ start:5815 stop:6585 length:771 start_codon:yes stop_codon:yes gene_type:complete